MRLGGSSDGSYYVPDCLDGISLCVSPGVSTSWVFELDLLNSHGIPSVLCDRLEDHSKIPFRVFDFWLDSYSRQGFSSLNGWMDSLEIDSNQDLLLQMDIEGSEYMTLLSAGTEQLMQFRILIVEFHNLHWLYNKNLHDTLLRPCFERLHESWVPVFIHPNNASPVKRQGNIDIPMTLEVTFLRRDWVDKAKKIEENAVSIENMKNVPEEDPIKLSSLWFEYKAN